MLLFFGVELVGEANKADCAALLADFIIEIIYCGKVKPLVAPRIVREFPDWRGFRVAKLHEFITLDLIYCRLR